MDCAHLSPAETSAAVSVQMEGIACIHMVPTHNLNITMMNYHSNNVVMPTNYCHGNKEILLRNVLNFTWSNMVQHRNVVYKTQIKVCDMYSS